MADRPLTETQRADVGEVFSEHRAFIESTAIKCAASRDDVPDIVQTVGLSLCRNLGRFRGQSHIRTWLYRITQNTAISFYRREQTQQRARVAMGEKPFDPDQVCDPDAHVIAGQRIDALRRAVDRLRGPHRTAVRDALKPTRVQVSRKPAHARTSVGRQRMMRARIELRDMLTGDPRIE